MKYFVSAGEPSGDLHAAELIKELRKADSAAEFVYLGGDLMRKAAGCEPVIDYRDMAFMGFSEVLRNLRKVFGNLSTARDAITAERPDALILIDYPSFNLKLARHAHKLGIPVYYYISPKVWAWKTWRVRDMRRWVDKTFSILPFEPEFMQRHNYSSVYVGNPSVEEIDRRIARSGGIRPDNERDRVLALVPGSRVGEIRNNLPIMVEVARRFPDLKPIIAGAPGIDPSMYKSISDYEVVFGETFELMGRATAALVTSGTATLECALLSTPQVVCYRANGSRLAYNLMSKVLKIPYVSLPNLIAGREIVDEALVHLCTPDLVAEQLGRLMPGNESRSKQLADYKKMREALGTQHAASRTAREIIDDLNTRRK